MLIGENIRHAARDSDPLWPRKRSSVQCLDKASFYLQQREDATTQQELDVVVREAGVNSRRRKIRMCVLN